MSEDTARFNRRASSTYPALRRDLPKKAGQAAWTLSPVKGFTGMRVPHGQGLRART